MAIALADLPIATVNQQLGLLIASDLPCDIDRVTLRPMHGRDTRRTGRSYRPPTSVRNDVLLSTHREPPKR